MVELLVSVETCKYKNDNRLLMERFTINFLLLDNSIILPFFAKEKARLKSSGFIIKDFDMLIGATSVYYGFTMAANNEKHFSRIADIKLETGQKPFHKL